MESKAEQAVELFSKGFNCSQSVFATYAETVGVTVDDALRAAAGFGGGIGRMQQTCGAVTGAVMVIGSKYGMIREGEKEAKEATILRVQEFARRFKELHGSLLCSELLGCDLNTEEGKRIMKEKDLSAVVCRACVRDAALILEETMLEK